MNAVTSLESLGLSLSLSENGKLAVEGLKRLSHEEREYALSLAQTHKSAIVSALRKQLTQPDSAALEHARRMLVDCPSTKGKRHCWHCSRCAEARTCTAWRTRRADVERFRQSGKPYSLYLVEGGEEETPGLSDWLERVAPGPTPDYAAFCSSYWRGCFECPDYLAGKLRFCARYNRLNNKAAEVEQ